MESPEDILKFDRNEILVKLEKGEGTLKIEKVAVKKETQTIQEAKDDNKNDATNKVELTLVKNDVNSENKEPVTEVTDAKEVCEAVLKEETVNKSDDEPTETDDASKVEETPKTEEKIEDTPKEETATTTAIADVKQEEEKVEEPKKEETAEEDKTKAKKIEEENDLCSKQAAELKAMFPDLEVIKPLSRLSQVDTFVLRDQKGTGALDFSETTVAQLLNNAVKWPKEYAIQVRLQHLIYAIETKEWPASKTFSAYASGIGNEFDIPIHELPNDPPKRDSSTPMSSVGESEVITITTDNVNRTTTTNKKRKRHIAIDVETERAKLHALLNNSHGIHNNPMSKHHPSWGENDDSEDSRRSTPVSQIQQLQPPPAHQHTSSRIPYDLKYHVPTKTIGQTTVIPGTSSTLTPIDLSSG